MSEFRAYFHLTLTFHPARKGEEDEQERKEGPKKKKMSAWNPDNIRDVAESVGITSINDDVTESVARDVEYRIAQVLEEALKSMRHSKRTVLTTQDIALALQMLDVEPLYGYESTRPLRFGEASLGPGQPLFYVEDEEVDFEKLINAPLPKIPREVSFTGSFISYRFSINLALIISLWTYSTLAGSRRCTAIHPAESYGQRFTQPGTRIEGPECECHIGSHQRQGRCSSEATCQARGAQGATAVL